MRGEPAAAEAAMTLHQPEVPCIFPWKLFLDNRTLVLAGCTGSGRGGVWIVTLACTQAS